MDKTESDLEAICSFQKKGSHEVLINATKTYINGSTLPDNINDSRKFNTNIVQLKRLRRDADYGDTVFRAEDSNKSILLSQTLLPILKKYSL